MDKGELMRNIFLIYENQNQNVLILIQRWRNGRDLIRDIFETLKVKKGREGDSWNATRFLVGRTLCIWIPPFSLIYSHI